MRLLPACAAFALVAAGLACGQEVRISSTPPGAMVFIDSAYAGTAPATKSLADGPHRVRLVRKGYTDWTVDVTVPLDKPAIDAILAAAHKGSIQIASVPSESTVYINNRQVGVTPLLIEDLADDDYEVRVHKANFAPYLATVKIAGGKSVDLSVTLDSRLEDYYLGKIKEKPDDLSNYTDLGHYYLIEKRFDDAIRIFKRGVDVSGKEALPGGEVMRFYTEIIKAYTEQYHISDKGGTQAFRDRFRKVVEYAVVHGPSKNQHCQRLVALYAAMGSAESMMKLAEQIQQADPKRDIYREFGKLYLERGMPAQAIVMLTRAVELNDEFGTRAALASAYHRSGKLDEALQHYLICKDREAAPAEKAELLVKMARAYSQRKEHDKALECVDQALKLGQGGQHQLWSILKANILLDSGKCDEARTLMQAEAATAGLLHDRKNVDAMLKEIDIRCKGKGEQN